MMKKYILCFCISSLVLCSHAQEINNSLQLVNKIYDSKAQRYETLTFVQQTISYSKTGEADTSIWYEALAPGKLRIDIAPVEAGKGVLYLGDTRYDFENNILLRQEKDYNPLMLFLSDIYSLEPNKSLYLLDSLNFDTSTFYKSILNDKEIYIIGSTPGDTLRNQVWIDSKLLLPVRIIEMLGKNKNVPLDVHIPEYRVIDNKYVETIIKIYLNGRLVQEEYYTKIKVNPDLDDQLFNPEKWKIDYRYWE